MGLESFKDSDTEIREFHGNQHTQESKVDEEDVIDRVKEIAEEKGETPVMRDIINEQNMPSAGGLSSMFGSWNDLLAQAGFDPNKKSKYTEEDKELMLEDLRRCYSETDGNLTVRRYIEIGEYGHNTVKEKFGSWSKATKEAGIQSGTKHGEQVQCQCGQVLDSVNEKVVGDILHQLSIEHVAHKCIPETNYKTDFYLPSINLWIEVDGYKNSERPNREGYDKKIGHYESNRMNYLQIKVPYTLNEDKVKQIIKEEL